jgi:hypothetical protein
LYSPLIALLSHLLYGSRSLPGGLHIVLWYTQRILNLIGIAWDGKSLSRKNCAAFCGFAKNESKLVDLMPHHFSVIFLRPWHSSP